jgi:amino acid adenylation domain-containing protein
MCLPDLFEVQVGATPGHPAVIHAGIELSYSELNGRANRLAHAMIARGIGPEEIVALALPRSIELIVAILAVLKTGAAYLPLDPEYPAVRLEFMLTQAAPALLISVGTTECPMPAPTRLPRLRLDDPATAARLAAVPDRDPTDADRTAVLLPAHPAYVIYTSGSTGSPKGVVVSHRGLPGLAASLIDRLGTNGQSRVLQSASISFDASVSDLCMALLSGAALVLPSAFELVPGAPLRAFVERHQVTHMALTPSALAVLDEGSLPCGVTLVLFGEPCPGELVSEWAPRHPMFNAYGPTEATACVTLSGPLAPRGRLAPPIGRPIGGNVVYVLDAGLGLVPPGVVGEMYLAGMGLARGYLGAPALTAERFVACPFAAGGGRMYRTGDLARWNVDGELEFVGRVDDQGQIWGQRVEPAEVEAALRQHPWVAQAAAVIREDQPGNRRLVAYVVPHPPSADAATDPLVDASSLARRLPDILRAFLAERLPAHLMPSAYVTLTRFPLTRNGKLDRAALMPPDFTEAVSDACPRTARERILAELFADVLGLPRVGVTDDFFSVGGTLLLASQLAARLRTLLGVELTLWELCQTPTVAGVAARLDGRLAEDKTTGSG